MIESIKIWIDQTDPAVLTFLGVVLALPALLVARFLLFMILPKSWLKRWFM